MNFFVYCILFQLIVAITPGDKVGYNLPQLGENQTGVKGVPSNQISNSNQNSNTNSNTNTNNQNIQSNPSKNTNTNNNNNNNNNNVQPNESKNNNPLSQSNDNKNNKQSNVDKATIQESKSSSEKTVESISTTPTTTSSSISSISSISPTTTSKSNEKTSSHNATSTDPTLVCLVESGCGPDIKCISRCAKVPNPNSDQVRRTGACMGRCNTTEHPLPPPNGEQVLQDRIATCYQKCLKGIYLAHFTKPKYRDIGVNSGSDGKGLMEIMIVIMAVIVFSFGV
ncbi:hypothetical protein K502DRAFT_322529 [Neoconidiobolus thromboides FSU 785]|nr:hypothetical protein K502DRAFT_322529 [Neoconidiobolus thromboides FSU 785]